MLHDYYAYHHRPNNQKKKHENRSRTETGWVARRLAQPPPHQPPNPTLATPANQPSNPKKPSGTRESRRKPVPYHRHLPSNQSAGRHDNTRHRTQRKHPPARQRATRNSGTAEAPAAAVNHSAGRPEFRNDDDTRARALARGESVVNAARRPTDTRRRNETGVRVRTSGAGGGGWSEAAERARDGKEGVGDEKKLVGEVGEGYKEGGSHLLPVYHHLCFSL